MIERRMKKGRKLGARKRRKIKKERRRRKKEVRTKKGRYENRR